MKKKTKKKPIKSKKDAEKKEIGICSNCDEPDVEGYHKAWCFEG